MKKIFTRKIITMILFCCILFLPKMVFAGTQTLENLDYEVTLQDNGDMKIVENWYIDLYDTNTLFKTFPKDGTYDEITDVTVSEISSSGDKIQFLPSDTYSYHVTENYYQALTNPDNDFEIAWGVNERSSEKRNFQICYTVKNVVKKYSDCAELYWKLIGDNFEIYTKSITGVINIPDGISDIEDLRVWAHGPLNGSINKEGKNKVTFKVQSLPINKFLEIRLAMPKDIFLNSTNESNVSRLSTILEEETRFADEANAIRARKARNEKIAEIVLTATSILSGIVAIIYTLFVLPKERKENPEILPEINFEYFREIPNEKDTIAEASYLYYLQKGGMSYKIGQIVSATLLNLSLKGWIEFEPNIKNQKKIIIKVNDNGKELKKDEEEVYKFLKKVKGGGEFTIKEFEDYCKSNSEKFLSLINSLSAIAEKENIEKDTIDLNIGDKKIKYYIWVFLAVVFIGIDICAFGFTKPIIPAVSIIAILIQVIAILKFTKRFSGLTQKGVNEVEKLNGLKKYMEDFSLLNEREVPELVLWEKFLVYATAFGIAEKVIKQLKVKFKELQDDEYMRTNFPHMYVMCNNNFDSSFVKIMNSSIGSAINYSSGTGAGGGFSSGGGGGGRRWRRRWSLKPNR